MITANSSGTSRPVAVVELQRAWTAVRAGDFRHTQDRTAPSRPGKPDIHRDVDRDVEHGHAQVVDVVPAEGAASASAVWAPATGERILPVVGSAGSVGASTVALALATASANREEAPEAVRSRVVECCSATSSGLAAASTAELGRHDSGWVRGTRERVLIERAGEVLVSAAHVPTPATASDDQVDDRDAAAGVTVLDTGWETGQLMATVCWLRDAVRRAPTVVVVARPTMPGFRRLEATLELLEDGYGISTQLALLGTRRQRWAKGVEHSAGPRTRAALREDRMTEIPEDRLLAVAGLSSTPLPPGLLAAADHMLARLLAQPLAEPSAELLGEPLDGPIDPSGPHDLDPNTSRSWLPEKPDSEAQVEHNLDAGPDNGSVSTRSTHLHPTPVGHAAGSIAGASTHSPNNTEGTTS